MLQAQAALLEPDGLLEPGGLLEPDGPLAGGAADPDRCKHVDRELRDRHPDPALLNISLVNVPYRAERDGFDGGVLDAFFRQREVEAAREYFYVVDGRPHLSCWIEWRERSNAAAPAPRKGRPGAARRNSGHDAGGADSVTPMSTREQHAFDALRNWRLTCSVGLGVPAYRVLTNRVMERIARAQPLELSQLGDIEGVGAATLETHGPEILEVLARMRAPQGERVESTSSSVAAEIDAMASDATARDSVAASATTVQTPLGDAALAPRDVGDGSQDQPSSLRR